MSKTIQYTVKYYKNRFGGFGIIPKDSMLVGEAFELATARTEDMARQIVDSLNVIQAMALAVKCSESETGQAAPEAIDAWIEKARQITAN